jgi:hypothetical protein
VWVRSLVRWLLLARSRHAATAFLLALIGGGSQLRPTLFTAEDKPASMEGGAAVAMPVVS